MLNVFEHDVSTHVNIFFLAENYKIRNKYLKIKKGKLKKVFILNKNAFEPSDLNQWLTFSSKKHKSWTRKSQSVASPLGNKGHPTRQPPMPFCPPNSKIEIFPCKLVPLGCPMPAIHVPRTSLCLMCRCLFMYDVSEQYKIFDTRHVQNTYPYTYLPICDVCWTHLVIHKTLQFTSISLAVGLDKGGSQRGAWWGFDVRVMQRAHDGTL